MSCCTAIDFKREGTQFATRDVDFFLGRNYPGDRARRRSRTIKRFASVCEPARSHPAEGPVALMHRIVDTMVDIPARVRGARGADRDSSRSRRFRPQHDCARVMKLKRDVSRCAAC